MVLKLAVFRMQILENTDGKMSEQERMEAKILKYSTIISGQNNFTRFFHAKALELRLRTNYTQTFSHTPR